MDQVVSNGGMFFVLDNGTDFHDLGTNIGNCMAADTCVLFLGLDRSDAMEEHE